MGDRSARIISPNRVDNVSRPGGIVTAPDEVETGEIDEELILAGRDRRRDEGGGIGDGLEGGGGSEALLHSLLDAEDEEDEEEGSEELKERGSLAPP